MLTESRSQHTEVNGMTNVQLGGELGAYDTFPWRTKHVLRICTAVCVYRDLWGAPWSSGELLDVAPRPDPSDSEFLLPGSRTQVGMLQSFLVKNHCIIAFFFFFVFLKSLHFLLLWQKSLTLTPLPKLVLESRCYRKGDFNSEYERNFLKNKWLKMKWTAL